MDQLLQGLRAAGEATRLRVLGLCAHAELTVTELVEILDQSQPRISRHLRLLVEAGLLRRHQEGNWAYYRLSEAAAGGELARLLVDLMPADDSVHAQDLARLQSVKEARAVTAAAYFMKHAPEWSRISAELYDDKRIDAALVESLGKAPLGDLLDIGTGTGHTLEVLGGKAESGIGIDRSIDMLKVARANIWRAGLKNCQVRLADMLRLPFPPDSFDTVTLRWVLHFSESPDAAIAEAARVLRPGGRLAVVDLAPHDRDELRQQHAHRWMGFEDGTLGGFLEHSGLVAEAAQRLDGGPLAVCLWLGKRPANDARHSLSGQEAG
jgi:ubiquinone/menaquinone biosynthesis C-methylase UbiE/DNA-binding transcriptional ArsR family regulator